MQQTDRGKVLARKERQSQIKQWWHQPVDQWKELLAQSGAQGLSSTGQALKFCCPYHNDTKPSATVDVVRGFFRCWAGSCSKNEQDPVRLLQTLTGATYTDALDVFKKHFKIKGVNKDDTKEFDADELLRRRAKMAQEAFFEYACSVFAADTGPSSAMATRKYVQEVRGIKDITNFPSFGMMPRSPTLNKILAAAGATKEDIHAIHDMFSDYLNTVYMDHIVFTYAKSPNWVTAFKIRPPNADKHIKTVDIFKDGIGAFGVITPVYYPLYNHSKVNSCFIVEGDFDQLSLVQGQIASGSFDEMFFALGGSGHRGADFLADLGITKLSVIGDDDESGENYARQVLKYSHKMSSRVFSWPPSLKNPKLGAIDPDEAIKIYGFPTVYTHLLDDKNYVYAPEWCMRRAEEELKNTPEDDVVEYEKIAGEWGGLLHSDIERKAYADKFTAAHSQIPLKSIMHSAARANRGPLGYEQRVVDWILERFHPTLNDVTTNELHLWHKATEFPIVVRRDTAAGVSIFKSYIPDGSYYQWFRQDIGLPDYFPDVEAEDATQSALDKVEAAIEKMVYRALSRVAAHAAVDKSKLLGQGLHFRNFENTQKAYLVNGKHFYRVEYDNLLRFKKIQALDGPSDGPILFDLEHRMVLTPTVDGWFPELKEDKFLRRKPRYTLKEVWNKIHEVIKELFSFKDQEVDTIVATGMVFYSYVLTAISDRRTLVHIHGLFESGKTTLLSLICNHPQLAEYAFTRSAACLDNCTPAAVFQAFNNSSLMMGLDEMNDPDDGSLESQSKQKIQQYVRGLATAGTTRRDTGTRSGQVRSMSLTNTMVSAAATLPANDMDASRTVILSLVKDQKKENARIALERLLTHDECEAIRHSVLVGMLESAGKVNQNYKALYPRYAKYAKENNLPTLNRDLENILPLAAVIDTVGAIDVMKFIVDYQASRKAAQAARVSSSEGNSLFDLVINADRIEVPGEDGTRRVSIRTMLVTPDLQPKINVYSNHVKFDLHTRSIVINWDDIYSLLSGTRQSRASKRSLKLLADSTSYYIHDDDAERFGIFARVKSCGLAGARLISAYSVDSILSDYENAVKWVQQDEEKRAKAKAQKKAK